MTEALFYKILWGWMGLAVATFILLFFVSAPYGRHGRKGWGPTLSSTAGWVIMEAVSLLALPVLFITGRESHGFADPAKWVFLTLWVAHYFQRTIIFPFRRKGSGRDMALSVVLMAAAFNIINAGSNGYYLFHLAPDYGDAWLTDPRFLVGVALFITGMMVNIHSDSILLNLRGPGKPRYSIPRGGLFRWVTSPNYLGEILEWVGWALATWSLAGAAFAVWTIANLAPRARTHHRWYKNKFDDYPQKRKVLVPYLW